MVLKRLPAAWLHLSGLLIALLIAGCHDGDDGSVTPTTAGITAPTSGGASVTPPATVNPQPPVTPAAPVSPPVVSTESITLQGVAPATVAVGSSYSFVPTVSRSSTVVMFSITGKPAWLHFDTSSGALSGTPAETDQGTTGHITITARNNTSSTSLTPFTIQVKGISSATSATLSWDAPTQNTDGTPISGLAGYHVYYGTAPDELTKTITVLGAASTTCVISDLPEGTYYFTVVAYSAEGSNSGVSDVASQTI